MSFWNFLGGFAIFNFFCDLFSRKPKDNYTNYAYDSRYRDYDSGDVSGLRSRIDDIEARISEIETNLPLSSGEDYADLRDELDELDYDLDELNDELDELEDLDY